MFLVTLLVLHCVLALLVCLRNLVLLPRFLQCFAEAMIFFSDMLNLLSLFLDYQLYFLVFYFLSILPMAALRLNFLLKNGFEISSLFLELILVFLSYLC